MGITTPSPCLSTDSRVAVRPNHWMDSAKPQGEHHQHRLQFFLKSQPYLRIFQPSAVSTLSRVARRPSERIERNHGASIISISWKSFTESQPHLRAFQPMAGKPFDRVIRRIQQNPRGEHHQHQLEIFLESQSQLGVFEPSAG